MLIAFEELGYPWSSAIDFWFDGYWIELNAIHLVLATFFIGYLFCNIISRTSLSFEFRCAVLYFSLTVFNNPAFSFFGINPNEFFGSVGFLIALTKGSLIHKRSYSVAVIGLILLFIAGFIHSMMATFVYPELVQDLNSFLIKIAVNLKILVLAVNLGIVGAQISRGVGLEILLATVVKSGMFALLMYILQTILMGIGSLPYGTYMDAGFIGLPSFGSVSIERGHFGKFMAPYFPFFLYAFVEWKATWRFLLYLIVMAINFSASSIFFFCCSLLLAGFFFWRSWNKRSLIPIFFASIALISLLLINAGIYEGIVMKILNIAIQGDESQGGGRSLGLFIEYINTYPFGMGYSGSTLRTAPSLPEINAAYFAFIAQYSLLAFPIVLGFIFIWVRAIRFHAKKILYRCFNVGVFMAPIIFLTDILWFVPVIWLSIEINLSANPNSKSL